MSILFPAKRSRRAILRGILSGSAVTVGLPVLDGVLNNNGTAFADTGKPLPLRFGTWYWGMGHTPNYAVKEKAQTGKGIEFLEECAALIPHKDKMNFFAKFNMPLDGRSNYTHFSGWVVNRTGTAPSSSSDIPATTLDLLIADVIGTQSRFRTIDATACGISRENYSARGTFSRAAAEGSPLALYARLFGPDFIDPNVADFKPDPRVMLKKSVLSTFTDESKSYIRDLGAGDKQRLDEYFTSIREVENQLALQLEKPDPNKACLVPEAPPEPAPDRIAAAREMGSVILTHEVMSKLLALAVACDQTRVFNMVYTDNFANVRRNGETYTHHLLTHEEAVDARLGYQPLSKWFQTRCMEGLAQYIETLESIKEGDGTLLDNCLLFASTETNYARVHTIDGVPTFLIGKAGGRMKTGVYVAGGGDPITRIGLTTMQMMGVPIEKWGTKSLQTSKPISDIVA